MGFVERAFTPPGTGGREAAAIQAQADAQAAIQKAQQQAIPKMPSAPEAPKPPSAAPQFMAGGSPGEKAQARATGTALGQIAAAGQQSRKSSVLG
jgi:hypothetical protein